MTQKQFAKILKEAVETEDMSTSSLKYIMDIVCAACSKYKTHYSANAHSEKDAKGNHVGYYFYLSHPNPWFDFRYPAKGSLPIKLSR